MRIRWVKAVVVCALGNLACSDASQSVSWDLNMVEKVEKWTETEVLTQKFAAEKKFDNSLQCLCVKDDLSVFQKDSLILHWSEHPDELNQVVSVLLDKK